MDLGKLTKFRWIDGLLILGVLLVVVGIGMNFKDQFVTDSELKVMSKGFTSDTKLEKKDGGSTNVDVQSNNEVVIDISGEVINPGLYRLVGDVRINDALIRAGGLSAQADRDWVAKNLNLAEKLMDGQKIFIPRQQLTPACIDCVEGTAGRQLGGQANNDYVLGVSQSKIVRINSATIEQLDTLSGVGPSIAKKIIDYRTQNGGFKNIEELKLVSGIGDKMYEKIKDDVSL